HRKNISRNAFQYYCGHFFGKFLEWFIPIFLFMMVVVMISGAGATMNQYFGTPQFVGTFLMASIVLITNFFGLQKIVDIIGYLGPITIIFTIFISIVALIKHPDNIENLLKTIENIGSIPK